jgi:hypothetical protein
VFGGRRGEADVADVGLKPHRARPNFSAAWQIYGEFLALAFFAEPGAATSPSRLCRKENWRKLLALSLPQDLSAQLMFDLGKIPTTRLKPSLGLEFCVDRCGVGAARRPRMLGQVPQGTQDFARNLRCPPSMRLKRFNAQAFPSCPHAAPMRTAFGLPQRA